MEERRNLFRHLVLVVGVLLIALPEPTSTFAGAILVAWALRPRLARLYRKLGPCRCDYHHYEPCQCQGFPYLQVWSGIPAPMKVSVEPRGQASLARSGLFRLSGQRVRRGDQVITYRGETTF